jgi:predicted transposase/invertase (TIGR01784 family)
LLYNINKDKNYLYKPLELEKEILVYNFITIDVEKIRIEKLSGGVFKISIDEIRRIHYTQKGKEQGMTQGIEQGKLEVAKNLLDILDDETISEKTGLSVELIKRLRDNDTKH